MYWIKNAGKNRHRTEHWKINQAGCHSSSNLFIVKNSTNNYIILGTSVPSKCIENPCEYSI